MLAPHFAYITKLGASQAFGYRSPTVVDDLTHALERTTIAGPGYLAEYTSRPNWGSPVCAAKPRWGSRKASSMLASSE